MAIRKVFPFMFLFIVVKMLLLKAVIKAEGFVEKPFELRSLYNFINV